MSRPSDPDEYQTINPGEDARNYQSIVIAHKPRDKTIADRLKDHIDLLQDSNGSRWTVETYQFNRGTLSKLVDKIAASSLTVYVYGDSSLEDVLSVETSTTLEDSVSNHSSRLIYLKLVDIPLPFGWPRGLKTIQAIGGVDNDHIQILYDEIKTNLRDHSHKPYLSLYWLQGEMFSPKNDGDFRSLKPFLDTLEDNNLLAACSVYLWDWISYVLNLNGHPDRAPAVRHSSMVLKHFNTLAEPRTQQDASQCLPNYNGRIVKDENQCFMALFGILLHNLPLLREIPGSPEGPYVENARNFMHRTLTFGDMVCSGLPEEARHLIAGAFWIGIEMFRDSTYWQSCERHHSEDAEIIKKRSRRYKKEHASAALVARMCEVTDVCHRCVPDIIRDLFTSADYVRGADWFFKNTFKENRAFLFSKPPELSKDSRLLILTWPNCKDNETIAFLDKIKKVVDNTANLLLRQLADKLQIPELATHIFFQIDKDPPIAERVTNIVWAFFPFAIEYQPSDSAAAREAVRLVPHLIDYLDSVREKLGWDDQVYKDELLKLFEVLGKMRRNSQTMPRIASVASQAIECSPIENLPEEINKSLQKAIPQAADYKWLKSRRSHCSPRESSVRRYFVFGISQPITEWLLNRCESTEKPIQVTFLYCKRRLLIPGSAFSDSKEALSVNEHESAMALLKQCLKAKTISRDRFHIDREVWDFNRLPELFDSDNHESEALIGARRFTMDQGKPVVIANYGADALTRICGDLHIPTRVVTWDYRLTGPHAPYRREFSEDRFSITYSPLGRFGAEDERVPIHNIDAVSTELRDLSAAETESLIITQNASPRDIKIDTKTDQVSPEKGNKREIGIQTYHSVKPTIHIPDFDHERTDKPIVLILTATDREYGTALRLSGVNKHLDEASIIRSGYIFVKLGIPGIQALLLRSSKGSSVPGGALVRTLSAIKMEPPPVVIITTGICFGLKPEKHTIGDVLVSEQLFAYEASRVSAKVEISRGDKVSVAGDLLDLFRHGHSNWARDIDEKMRPRVKFGTFLSGDKLIDNPSFVAKLKEWQPEALGGDMEAAGVYVAASEQRIRWIAVKSICDWGMGKANFHQQSAAENAIDFVFYTLRKKAVAEALASML